MSVLQVLIRKMAAALIYAAFSSAIAAGPVTTADLVTGAIPLNPKAASVADQDILIGQLKDAGVHLIRIALTTDDARISFAKRAYDQGIKIEALI